MREPKDGCDELFNRLKLFPIRMDLDGRYVLGQNNRYSCLLFGKNFLSFFFFPSNAFWFFLRSIPDTIRPPWKPPDLDDTLYPLSTGLATACRDNIGGTSLTKILPLILLEV